MAASSRATHPLKPLKSFWAPLLTAALFCSVPSNHKVFSFLRMTHKFPTRTQQHLHLLTHYKRYFSIFSFLVAVEQCLRSTPGSCLIQKSDIEVCSTKLFFFFHYPLIYWCVFDCSSKTFQCQKSPTWMSHFVPRSKSTAMRRLWPENMWHFWLYLHDKWLQRLIIFWWLTNKLIVQH